MTWSAWTRGDNGGKGRAGERTGKARDQLTAKADIPDMKSKLSAGAHGHGQALFRSLPIALMLWVWGGASLYAAVRVLRVEPGQTDPAIESVHGPHIALYDPQAADCHRLYLFLVGTGGKATGSLKMDSIVAGWGYHAISLDYENKVVAVACAHSLDRTAFGRYREAIVTGAAVSDKIKVTPANSILNRFEKLLTYLVKHDPEGGWDQFVKDGQPVWNHIIVGGHSQGSGHAAYIGKMFSVDRVLIFSGPQDYMDDLHQPAQWQANPSATPPSRFFAFLAKKDPFNVQHQIANCLLLMHLSKPETLAVKPGEAIHSNWHILINDIPTKSPHGSTVLPEFKNVWKYMLTVSVR
jgi:hypothetical protein